MRAKWICLALLGATMTVSTGHAQEATVDGPPPNDLSCQNLAIPITGVPDDTPLTFTIPLDDIKSRCVSNSGATVTLVTPTAPITVTVTPNSNQTFSFSVQDDQGNSAAGTITVTRN